MIESFDKKSTDPFVSVLTPAYNEEKYLEETIESVLVQTYSNWEYVIVNNCSTDRTLEIAESYAREEEKIKIYTNEEFLEQMQNLNHAFKYISQESKYCKVIHANDWMFPHCIEQMVEVAEKYPSVGIVSSYGLIEERLMRGGLPYPSHCTPGREIGRRLFLDQLYLFGAPSDLLIRSEEIRKRNNKIYDESNVHSDVNACLDILKESDFGFVHQVLTYVRRNPEGAYSHAQKFDTNILGFLKAFLGYGTDYLSEQELQEETQAFVERYHRFIAEKIFLMNQKEVVKFHINELKSLPITFSYLKLAKYLLNELLYIRRNVEGVMNRIYKVLFK